MSQQALADKVTEWAIYALRTFATLAADLQVVPFAGSDDAENERLVVKCEVGAKMNSGPKPYQCQLSFELNTVNAADEANDVFAKVEAAMAAALNDAASVAYATTQGFTWLQIFTEEADTSLDNSNNFRKYNRTFPLRALTS